MAPLTIPKNFKFKPLFPLLASATTIIKNVDVEMVVETLIFDIIDLASKSKKLLTPSPQSQTLVVKKKKHDNEGTCHFQD
jgi:hypothetical protein